jgi:hypothetical protein
MLWRYVGKGDIAAFLTSELDGGDWSVSRLGRFTSEEIADEYSLHRNLVGAQSQPGSSREAKNIAMPGIEQGPSSKYPVTISTEQSRLWLYIYIYIYIYTHTETLTIDKIWGPCTYSCYSACVKSEETLTLASGSAGADVCLPRLWYSTLIFCKDIWPMWQFGTLCTWSGVAATVVSVTGHLILR